MENLKRAVILLSGGLDSATVLAIARRQGFACHALSIAYGQRHAVELAAARRVATSLGVAEHREMHLDLRALGGSALTADMAMPVDRTEGEMAGGIPITYVPARNTIFLALALAYAEVIGAFDLFIGVNAVDYSVAGETRIWVRSQAGARPTTIEEFDRAPEGEYETLAVDPGTLKVGWHRVRERIRHPSLHKRCYRVTLERGQRITVTEDHSLFTLDPETAGLCLVRGDQVRVGTPLVVPFDLSAGADAWAEELPSIDIRSIPARWASRHQKASIIEEAGRIRNRIGRASLPADFPLTDDFLYIVGLWLAEGGKEPEGVNTALAFSVGGIPGAVETLDRYFGSFGVRVCRSPANRFDVRVHSSTFTALFERAGLLGTAKAGTKRFPTFFWRLSQRQRRVIVAGLWDGDGSHVFNGEAVLAQKSHALVAEAHECLLLDGLFPVTKPGPHSQRHLVLGRAVDFRRFVRLYPLRHPSKLRSLEEAGRLAGREKTTGLWKCPGVWQAVSRASLPAGAKTRIYNSGGKYDGGVRAQRSAFAGVGALRSLVESRLAFLRVTEVQETRCSFMYDLSVEGAENFVANGILAHNSGYPDCRPEFIEAFRAVANLATKAGVEGGRFDIHTPLIALSKADIIRLGASLGLDYGLTHSCYDPTPAGLACGRCDSCRIRAAGFLAAGVPDPTRYA
jgi:7-cyano-7-deazaguanine synthase in queuosine biosynthesis